MKLNLFMCFFVFVFETTLKDYRLFSPILYTLCFRYLNARMKESCMYLSGQRFFKTPQRTLKISRKFEVKYIFQRSSNLNFKFSLQYLLWGHPTEPLN